LRFFDFGGGGGRGGGREELVVGFGNRIYFGEVVLSRMWSEYRIVFVYSHTNRDIETDEGSY